MEGSFRMETATLIVIVILILALMFFGYTILNSSSDSGRTTGSYSTPSYSGGACGR